MQNNTTYTIAGIAVVLILIASGFYFSKRAEAPAEPQKDESGVAVNSTGGTLTVTSIPLTASSSVSTPEVQNKNKIMNHANIDTNFGKITLELYRSDAPKTVENFVSLAEKGFYDNLTFHRVIKDFMIQGGDPTGNGTGGPGYSFADELNPNTQSYKTGYKKGVLAMANAGPNTNGSQFFIMLADMALPHNYTIFGRVVSGQDVVDKIGAVKTGANDKPLSPVIMKSVTVSE